MDRKLMTIFGILIGCSTIWQVVETRFQSTLLDKVNYEIAKMSLVLTEKIHTIDIRLSLNEEKTDLLFEILNDKIDY